MRREIIIIGGGIGGLSAGTYAAMNGYRTRIFEMHSLPGGVCTSWRRKGYTFDGCIHHLAGCRPGSHFHDLWAELGVMPGHEVFYPEELVRLEGPGGKSVTIYTDLDRLEESMARAAPADAKTTGKWVSAMRRLAGTDVTEAGLMSWREKLALLRYIPEFASWGRYTLDSFALRRLRDPFLRKVWPSMLYDTPSNPQIIQMNLLAACSNGDYGWPAGGSLAFARRLAERCQQAGCEIHYKAKVEEVLVENDRAAGIRLADGTEEHADAVISNAPGYPTIYGMLGGRYTSKGIRQYYGSPVDEIGMGIHVSLGIDMDLSGEPHAIVSLLEKPVLIAGQERDRLNIEIFSFDPSMAPAGKTSLKVTFKTGYSFWKQLYSDRTAYDAAKQAAAQAVIDVLDKRFSSLAGRIEAVDVATPITTERYTGTGHGFKMSPLTFLKGAATGKGLSMTLPGLQDFYMVGQWAGTPGLTMVTAMGRKVIKSICGEDGKTFLQRPAS